MKALTELLRETFSFLFRYSFVLIGLQAFEIVSQGSLMLWPDREGSPYLAIAVLFPLTWLLSSISLSATYVFIRDEKAGNSPSFSKSFGHVFARMGRLMTAQTLAGLLVVLGLLVILPALYFIAVYLFVPLLVMEQPPRPASLYLLDSKKMVRPVLWPVLGLSLIILLMGLGLGELEGWIGPALRDSFTTASDAFIGTLSTILSLFLDLVICASLNTFVSVLFLRLWTSKTSLVLVRKA